MLILELLFVIYGKHSLELPEAIIASDHILALLTYFLTWLHPGL
jgi:hypothetical protein